MSDIREYVVYEMPNGDILLDWEVWVSLLCKE